MSHSEGAGNDSARTVAARAPGRLDVMGGIADYSGSLVLQLPLAVATQTTIEPNDAGQYIVVSSGTGSGPDRHFSISTGEAARFLGAYDTARAFFAERHDIHWASYVLGCMSALVVEEGRSLPAGLSIRISSDIPEGKGVSSSAALEVSVMGALVRLLGLRLGGQRIAHLCQVVENQVAGAPCGIMDQMTAACGRRNHLLRLLCQPAELQGHIAVPDGLSIWGIDSGLRHFVGGSDYGTVRTAAAMGYRIIAELESLPVERIADGKVVVHDGRFGGYLANVGVSNLGRHIDRLPERMTGIEFMRSFDGIADDTVSIDPATTYPVRAATAHPVHEHVRNLRFASLLLMPSSEKIHAMLGELMYLCHASYSACGLGSAGTDRIVELVKEAGYHEGLFGARITGGGSGGTVAVLASSDAEDGVRRIAKQYAEESGYDVTVFEGSSNGLAVEHPA